MLELRPNCESCDCDLPPSSPRAFICTFECTFCIDCADRKFGFTCPNCGGELLRRPIRPEEKLKRFPAGSRRIVKDHPPRES